MANQEGDTPIKESCISEAGCTNSGCQGLRFIYAFNPNWSGHARRILVRCLHSRESKLGTQMVDGIYCDMYTKGSLPVIGSQSRGSKLMKTNLAGWSTCWAWFDLNLYIDTFTVHAL